MATCSHAGCGCINCNEDLMGAAAQMIANGAGNKNLREKLMTVYEKYFYRTDRE